MNNNGLAELRSTIIANNVAPEGPDCFLSSASATATTTSLGYNLLGVDSDCQLTSVANDLVGTAAGPLDPLLGPLQDNGGATGTHALLAGSPAVNQVIPVENCIDMDGSLVTNDQRGVVRPQGVACDIGAFEVVP